MTSTLKPWIIRALARQIAKAGAVYRAFVRHKDGRLYVRDYAGQAWRREQFEATEAE